MSSGIKRFIAPTITGGSRFGAHFLMAWRTCPQKWFYQYKRPHPTEGGEGIRTRRTASPLIVGSMFHDGIEAYYHSGFKTGEYDIEAALSSARETFLSRKDEFTSTDIAERD